MKFGLILVYKIYGDILGLCVFLKFSTLRLGNNYFPMLWYNRCRPVESG
jgi:hypothetical protein